jgi:arabinogalactan oligomer/maltooligosaccharide transport system permease protein
MRARSVTSRLVATFSGPAGVALKFVFLGLFNALIVWAVAILIDQHKWVAMIVTLAAAVAIDAIYLARRKFPLKFLVPGTIFLIAFSVIPIIYTVNVAFTNYSTGHILSRSEAIEQIKENTQAPPANGRTYNLTPALDNDGDLVLLLVDADTGKTYVGTREGLTPLPRSSVKVSGGAITAASGYKVITGARLFSLDKELNLYRVPTPGGSAIQPQGIDNAVQLAPTLRYDPKAGTFTSIKDGVVYRDNGRGSFVATIDGTRQALEPGWKTYVGLLNFTRIIHDPLIRNPFLRVLLWTIVFAFLTVLLSFALGLFLAITLQKKFRLQRVYRLVLVLPYAIPAFLTILIWGGLMNPHDAILNSLFHVNIPWLYDPWWARVSIIIVSIWLTFPYFFLVSLGALQSIPGELVEAARVDGAGSWQVFRKITLPLLLVAVAPLTIASFAFNFNNFNIIYLLTQGGPAAGDQSIAGTTDILISYTFKLAFQSGKGGNYALAGAITILIFFIVATISGIAFWRTKALETLR